MKRTGPPLTAEFDRIYGIQPAPVGVGSIYARSVLSIWQLEDERDVACFAIAHGARPKEAARDAGVPIGDVYHWLKEPDFKARVDEIRQALFAPLRDEIQATLSDAVHVIRDNMQQRDDPKLQQRAAEFFIDRFGASITDVAVQPPPAVQINVDASTLKDTVRARLNLAQAAIVEAPNDEE